MKEIIQNVILSNKLFIPVIIISLGFPFILLFIINIKRLLLHQSLKFIKFPFSNFSFYIFHLIMLVPVLGLSFIFNKIDLVYFVIFAIAGVIGEIIFSILWDTLFDKKFWEYKVKTIWNGYSSWLNFIPWGIGGLMYLNILRLYNFFFSISINKDEIIYILIILWSLAFLCMLIVFIFQSLDSNKKTLEFKEVSLKNYFKFSLPIIMPIIIGGIYYTSDIIFLAILFGLIAFIAEYLYGKFCTIFISKKLWTYTYYTFDKNHGTPLAIIPFTLGGFYFISIFLIIQMFI